MAEKDTIQTVIEHTENWVKIAEKKWLPKKFLVHIDTTKPCVFQLLCDALKTSKVIEVDFSACGLGSLAMKILSDYVRDATAVVARLILDENPLTGGRRSTDFDTDITGITDLCETLKTSSVTELGLAICRLGPGSLCKLAEYVREA